MLSKEGIEAKRLMEYESLLMPKHWPVIRASVCKINDQLKGFMTKGLEREDDVIDEEIAVCFADLVATRNVVKNGISGAWSSGLGERNKGWKNLTIKALLDPILHGAILCSALMLLLNWAYCITAKENALTSMNFRVFLGDLLVAVAFPEMAFISRSIKTCTYLIEDVERLDWLELVLLVHVVLRHDLFELCARHVHRGPPRVRWELDRINIQHFTK